MVMPLFAISSLWERRDWRSSRLFQPRAFTYRIGPLRRTIGGMSLASGALLVVMGIATLWMALTGPSMPSPGGWASRITATLQHYGQVVTDWLSWVPGWAAVLVLGTVVALLARRALRQVGHSSGPQTGHVEHEESPATEEEILEYDA
jgi:cytochrome c-type biogenesis protein